MKRWLCCDNSNQYALYSPDGEDEYFQTKPKKIKIPIFELVVITLLLLNFVILSFMIYMNYGLYSGINPIIPNTSKVINATNEYIPFPALGQVINKTSVNLPNLQMIIDHAPEISRIITTLNGSLDDITSVLANVNKLLNVVNTPEHMKDIELLVETIPEIINVINFINGSIPDLEYILHFFDRKTTTTTLPMTTQSHLQS